METTRTDIVPQNTSASPRKRVARACERCKRQKLKCDSYRPCALCVRTGKTCVPSQLRPRRPRRRTTPEDRVRSNDPEVLPSVASLVGIPLSPTNPGIGYNYAQHTSSLSPPMLLPTPDTPRKEESIPTKTSQLVALLPNKPTTRFLSSVYFERINWYTLLFHQGVFTFDLETVLAVLGRGPELDDSAENFSFTAVLILVLASGALCVTKDPKLINQYEELGEVSGEIGNFVEKVLGSVSQCYLDLVELENLESVQICILLGQLHLHHTRRHKRATECISTGVRIAEILGLETRNGDQCLRGEEEGAKEEDIFSIRRELSLDQIRKRVFWTLFEVERTMSLYYGGRLGITYWERGANDYEELKSVKPRRWYSVGEWRDGVDPADKDDGGGITLLEFRKRSAELWVLVGEILGRVYGVNRRCPDTGVSEDLEKKIKEYREKLDAWHESLHPCLRLSNQTQPLSPSSLPHCPAFEKNTFQLQSLSFQLSFNNALLILYRPLLAYPSIYPDAIQTCLSASVQISEIITEHPQLLTKALSTHVAVLFGPHFFMAGMVLYSILAMKPSRPEANEIRQGIYRILESLRKIEDWERVELLQKLLEGAVKRDYQKMIHGFSEPAGEDVGGENPVFREIMEDLRNVCSNATVEEGKKSGTSRGGNRGSNYLEMEQLWIWFRFSSKN
ncbi:hypothetical protein RUND412_008006 [Rhizina undulata]